VDRGLKSSHPRHKKLLPDDWVEWLIVALLFAVSAVGVFVLTHSLLSALLVGLLVWIVALGVVAML
jgi:CHASE2 domain-containing sensor protein